MDRRGSSVDRAVERRFRAPTSASRVNTSPAHYGRWVVVLAFSRSSSCGLLSDSVELPRTVVGGSSELPWGAAFCGEIVTLL